ncbi:hypothetical protein SMICM304S_09061 [Streptomyces microflavus]
MPGWDQVSQSPSGEKARSRTGPLTERISSVSPGVLVDRRRTVQGRRTRGRVQVGAGRPAGSPLVRQGLRFRLPRVQEQQPPVVRRDGEALAVRVGDHLLHPAQLPRGEPARGPVAAGARQVGDLHRVLAVRVGDVRDLAPAAEHLRQPHPHPRGVADGAGGAVAVGEPVEAAAYGDGAGPARLVDRERVDVAGGGHLVAPPAGARASQAYLELARGGVRRLQVLDQPEVTGALVDDAVAVAGGVAGVEGVVVGVAAQIGAVGPAGVEVADALVVGEERDAAADEHR